MLSVIGVIYRIARVTLVSFSISMVSRKYHGKEIQKLGNLSTSDLFVLELVIQNLNHNPKTVRNFMVELSQKIKEDNSKLRDKRGDLDDGLNNKKKTGHLDSKIRFTNETNKKLYGQELPANIDIS